MDHYSLILKMVFLELYGKYNLSETWSMSTKFWANLKRVGVSKEKVYRPMMSRREEGYAEYQCFKVTSSVNHANAVAMLEQMYMVTANYVKTICFSCKYCSYVRTSVYGNPKTKLYISRLCDRNDLHSLPYLENPAAIVQLF